MEFHEVAVTLFDLTYDLSAQITSSDFEPRYLRHVVIPIRIVLN